MALELAIAWVDKDGVRRSVPLSKLPDRFFVGRLASTDMEVFRRQSPNPFQVYIFNSEAGFLQDTGYRSLKVSRRHLLAEKTLNGLVVVDHGSTGRGSTNGTLVEGQALKPGERRLVEPGQRIVLAGEFEIKLVYMSEGRIVEYVPLGTPVAIDSEVKQALEAEGFRIERAGASSTFVVKTSGATGQTEQILLREREIKLVHPLKYQVMMTLQTITGFLDEACGQGTPSTSRLYEAIGRLEASLQKLQGYMKHGAREAAQLGIFEELQASLTDSINRTLKLAEQVRRKPSDTTILRTLCNNLRSLKGRLDEIARTPY